MLTRRALFAALLLLSPVGAAAQRRETPFPRLPAPVLAAESSSGPIRPSIKAGAAGPVRHALAGALIGAAAGFGTYLVLEETTRHTDHSYDPLVRFTAVTTGAAAGAVAGLVVYAARKR